MSNDNNFDNILKELENFQKIQQEYLQTVLDKVDNVFTTEQSVIIKDLLKVTYNLTRSSEEMANSYLNLTTVIETFFQVLVEEKQIITQEEFDKISQKIFYEKVEKLKELEQKVGTQ